MRNVIFDDNRNMGRINEKFFVLGRDVDAGFERFALDYIGYMTFEETRSYTAGFVKLVEAHRSTLKEIYSPRNLTNNVETLFDSLFKTIEDSLYEKLEPVRTAINSKPEAKKCWIIGKAVICKLINAVGAKIDEILKLESRHYERVFDKLLNSVASLPEIFQQGYKRCRDPRLENHPEERKKCAAHGVRIIKCLFLFGFCLTFIVFLFSFVDEREKQIIFA